MPEGQRGAFFGYRAEIQAKKQAFLLMECRIYRAFVTGGQDTEPGLIADVLKKGDKMVTAVGFEPTTY